MNIHIHGKVFNLPVNTQVNYDQKHGCVYVLIAEERKADELNDLIKNTIVGR
jgi:hypothetical protein